MGAVACFLYNTALLYFGNRKVGQRRINDIYNWALHPHTRGIRRVAASLQRHLAGGCPRSSPQQTQPPIQQRNPPNQPQTIQHTLHPHARNRRLTPPQTRQHQPGMEKQRLPRLRGLHANPRIHRQLAKNRGAGKGKLPGAHVCGSVALALPPKPHQRRPRGTAHQGGAYHKQNQHHKP